MTPTSSFYAVPQHSRAFRSIFVGILLYNYYLCVVTDPGTVPHNWVRNAFAKAGVPHLCEFIQEPEFDDNDGYEVKKQSGAPRYCRMCKKFKPPRAHHCKTCKRYASAVFAIFLSEYRFSTPVDVFFAWVSMHMINN